MKKSIRIAVMILALALSASALTACAKSGSKTESSAAPSAATQADDYSHPDITVSFGDEDAIQDVRDHMMIEGDYEGKIIKIDGTCTKESDGTYRIYEDDGGDFLKIGVAFQITDMTDANAYPADGARITITGKVVSDGSFKSHLAVPSAYVVS